MKNNLLFSATPLSGIRFPNFLAISLNRSLAVIALLFVLSHSVAHAAQSVTLAWNASPSTGVTGYKVRYGTTSGNPSQSITVGNTTSATVANLNDATTYYFTVTAYNAAGLESQPSNEVSYRTPAPATGPQLPTYALTVNDGTGSGNYTTGTQVPVSANTPPAGQVFTGWTGDTAILPAQDLNKASTTVLMPSMDVAITANYAASTAGTGLLGKYYNDDVNAAYPLTNPFAGSPVLTRVDPTVDFEWGGNSPGSPVTQNNFSAKWIGQVQAPVSGSYTFSVTGDDGVRLFLNGTKVIDGWKNQPPTTYTYTTTLTAGTRYNIELHYYEAGSGSVCRLRWSYPGQTDQVLPKSQLYPAAN